MPAAVKKYSVQLFKEDLAPSACFVVLSIKDKFFL